jgi:NADH:ubiquinone oxidoreductase subunit H
MTKTTRLAVAVMYAAGTMLSTLVAIMFTFGWVDATTIPILNTSVLAASPGCWWIFVVGFFFATILFVRLCFEHPVVDRRQKLEG